MAVGIGQSSVGVLTCCGRLRGGRFRSRCLVCRRCVFRSALSLNLLGVENTIGAVSAFDESLRVVLKRVRRRLGAAICNLKLQALFIDLEIGAGALSANASRNYEPGDSQPLSMRLVTHSLELFDGDVVAFAFLNAGKCEIRHRPNDYKNRDTKTKKSTGRRHALRVFREHGVFKEERRIPIRLRSGQAPVTKEDGGGHKERDGSS